jgi:hypothetical protein
MTARPFETVAFHMYPVVGFSFRLTSTRSLAGTVRISPSDVPFTKMVVTEEPGDAGVAVMLAEGEAATEFVVSAGTLTGAVVSGGTVVVGVAGAGAVFSVHPAKSVAARMRTQPMAMIR